MLFVKYVNHLIEKKKFCVVLVLEKYFYSKEILVSHVFCSMLLMP